MDKLKHKRPKPIIGDAQNPEGLYRQMLNYLEDLTINGYSQKTVEHREESLRRFLRWCEARDLNTPQEVDITLMTDFKKHLFYYQKQNGKPLSQGTQRGLLSDVKMYFRYLAKKRVILFNPVAELDMPRERQTLPKDILSLEEVKNLLLQPDTATPFGIRDRAIMETLYSTGIRRLECANLEVGDVDINRETLFIKQGKGGKDRVIPISQRALKWIQKYLTDVRPMHSFSGQVEALFLTQYGKAITAHYVSDQVKRYMRKINITKEGASHLFRHSMATHILENGADIRYIQAMLGHSDIGTTQVYTQVSIGQLKKVHQETHPAQ